MQASSKYRGQKCKFSGTKNEMFWSIAGHCGQRSRAGTKLANTGKVWGLREAFCLKQWATWPGARDREAPSRAFLAFW